MKYRKKPIVIEAFKYDGNFQDSTGKFYVPMWAENAYYEGALYFKKEKNEPQALFISRWETDIRVSVGDYIIRGIEGELYPCKPDIFGATYDLVDEQVEWITSENVEKYIKKINEQISKVKYSGQQVGEISDTYHTFNELYDHRAILFSIICNMFPEKAWKAKKHSDGEIWDGLFIAGVETPEGQYTYHYLLQRWELFKVKEIEFAPPYDGHTPKDIIRLFSLLENKGKKNQ